MKLLFENWRKILEGEVIEFPQTPRVSDEDIQKLLAIENSIADLVAELYGGHGQIPVNIILQMEELVDSLEESLKK